MRGDWEVKKHARVGGKHERDRQTICEIIAVIMNESD